MADEWGVLGWTAQQPPTQYADIQTAPWQIPSDIETVNVTGEYHSISGGRATGWVTFKANVSGPLLYTTTNAEMTMPTFTAFIGMDGKFSINIPATDGTKLSPSGFTYDVQIAVNHKLRETFSCSLPKATTPVDIHNIVRITGTDVTYP